MLSRFGNVVVGGAAGLGAVYAFARLVRPDLPQLEGTVAAIPLGLGAVAWLESPTSTRWSRTQAVHHAMKRGTNIAPTQLDLLGRTKVIDLAFLKQL